MEHDITINADMPCRFCFEHMMYNIQFTKQFFNIPLCVTEHFYVLPALGPIKPGHVIVFTKKHYSNFSCLDDLSIHEYQVLLRRICGMPPYSSDGILEYENGMTQNFKGGACIGHAHINIIPCCQKIRSIVPAHPEFNIIRNASIFNLPKQIPYLFIRTHDISVVCDASNMYPQKVRIILMKALDETYWDWSEHPNLNQVKKTISYWLNFDKPQGEKNV